MLQSIKGMIRGVFVISALVLLICAAYALSIMNSDCISEKLTITGDQIDLKNIYGTDDMSVRFDFEGKTLTITHTNYDKVTKETTIPIEISDDGRIYLLEKLPSNSYQIYDETTDDIWEKMGINVFTHFGGSFIYKYKTRECIFLLGNDDLRASFRYFCAADLNNDGNYQLLYFYTVGSGVHGYVLNCYSEKLKFNTYYRDMISLNSYLLKIDDQNVYIIKIKFEKQGEEYVALPLYEGEVFKLRVEKRDGEYIWLKYDDNDKFIREDCSGEYYVLTTDKADEAEIARMLSELEKYK